MKHKDAIQNHGFIAPEIVPEDYMLGGYSKLPTEVLQENRDWSPWVQPDELQKKRDLETYNCTNYGTNNAVEILLARKYGVGVNWSERFTGVNSGTTKNGNTPKNAAETIRKQGMIEEGLLPFDDSITTWEEYYSPNPMPAHLKNKGKQWIKRYDFGYEYVFMPDESGKAEKIYEALTYSPVCASVVAWIQGDGEFYVKDRGQPDTHWTVVCGCKKKEYFEIADSYPPFRKRVPWDYDFGFAMRYDIAAIARPSILDFIKGLFGFSPFLCPPLLSPDLLTR